MHLFYKVTVVFLFLCTDALLGVQPIRAYYIGEIILDGDNLIGPKQKQQLLAPYLHVHMDVDKINQIISDIKAF